MRSSTAVPAGTPYPPTRSLGRFPDVPIMEQVRYAAPTVTQVVSTTTITPLGTTTVTNHARPLPVGSCLSAGSSVSVGAWHPGGAPVSAHGGSIVSMLSAGSSVQVLAPGPTTNSMSAQAKVSPKKAAVPVSVEVSRQPVDVQVVVTKPSLSEKQTPQRPQQRDGNHGLSPPKVGRTAGTALPSSAVSPPETRGIPGTGLESMDTQVQPPCIKVSGPADDTAALPTQLLDCSEESHRRTSPSASRKGGGAGRLPDPSGSQEAAVPTSELGSPVSTTIMPLVMFSGHFDKPSEQQRGCSGMSALSGMSTGQVNPSERGSDGGASGASQVGGMSAVSGLSDSVSQVGGGSGGGSPSGKAKKGRPHERPIPIIAMPVLAKTVVGPFSQEACGANVALSEDGFTATRRCGCRECAVLGSEPLRRQTRGLYFEVVIDQVLEGWMGGLALGVTHTVPGQVQRLPDKAWRVPESFIVGYSGSAYLGSVEQRVSFQPDTLKVGQRVGLLITGDGRENMIVFVDMKEVLRIDGGELHAHGLRDAPLYPLVDVFNAAQAVTLSPCAMAPLAY